MSISGPFKVECRDLFPHGVGVVGTVTALDDLSASTNETRVQARDAESGLPLWRVEVMDFDPEARDRVFSVTIAAAARPVLPQTVGGTPVRPVVLDGLTVNPYVTRFAELGYSLRATGLSSVLGNSELAA